METRETGEMMAGTNITTKKTTPTIPTKTTSTKKTSTSSATTSNRSSAIASSSAGNATVQQAKASDQAVQQAANANAMGTGIFNWQLPNIIPSLDQFLGLPSVIDWQDIAIRTGLVVTGIILLLLVAWAFVRGKQQTTVNVQLPHDTGKNATTEEAMETAEIA